MNRRVGILGGYRGWWRERGREGREVRVEERER